MKNKCRLLGFAFWTQDRLAINIQAMRLLDYTIETGFLPNLKCNGMEQAIKMLAEGLAMGGEITDVDPLVHEVMRREGEGSTAIGGGLVIPHARFSGVTEVRIAVATLAEPLDIPSEDGRKVDVVILLVGPEGDPRQMLRVLARLARLVRNGDFLDGLRSASDAAKLRTSFGMMTDPRL